jgi:hypothetical protein
MFIFLFPALLSSVISEKVDPKEEICFLMSTTVVHKKREEIDDHNKLHPHLSPSHLKMKVIEETFKRCMKEIKPQEVKLLMEDKNSIMSYSSYYAASIGDLDCQEALTLGPDFFETRSKISDSVFGKIDEDRLKGENEDWEKKEGDLEDEVREDL